MGVVEVEIDGQPKTFAQARRRKKKKVPTKLKPGFKAFGVPGDETPEQLQEKKRAASRQRMRNRLLTIVRQAMKKGEKGKVNMKELKEAYELLLKDEAAEFKREQAGVASKPIGPVIVTDEEMATYVRGLLGKEITL